MSEKGIIFDIKRYAVHDGPGIRTTVFFKGCPLNCWWCHNPESGNIKPETVPGWGKTGSNGPNQPDRSVTIGREATVGEVMHEVLKDNIFYEESGGGVTFSGGEPLLQPDFLSACLKACKSENLHTTVDTTGYASRQKFQRILNVVDLFLFDLKLMDDEKHRQYTGVSNKKIHSNLKNLLENRSRVIIRLPLIPGISDTDKNVEETAVFIKSLQRIDEIHILPFNRAGEHKYRKLKRQRRLKITETQPAEKVDKIKRKLESYGFIVKTGG